MNATKLKKQLNMDTLKNNISNYEYNAKLTLMDLVTILTDEAYKICRNKAVANTIALKSLKDYTKKHVNNIKVVF